MNPDMDYWDNLMGDDEGASNYMFAYGEGPGCETRMIISSLINDGESVLDAGCGPGWNFDHFREFGPRIGKYKGIDLSPRFIRVANKRFYEKYGHSKQKISMEQVFLDTPFKVGDIRHLLYKNKSWDVVLLQDVLEHTNGYEKPVLEALRVAKKRVIVVFWRQMDGVTTKTNDDTDKGTNGYGSDYNKDEWEEWLDTLGYLWLTTETSPEANRHHTYYIIDKLEGIK